MSQNREVYIVPNVTGPTEAVSIDHDLCVGCNHCVNICRMQVIMKNPENGKPPVVVYPDECWYCACCVEECRTGALQMRLPINMRTLFKRKSSGQIYRIGQLAPPEKSYFMAPYGWIKDEEGDEEEE